MEMSKAFNHIKAYASKKDLPIIPICANDISFISEPSAFYKTLLNKTRQARYRVALSALYIGTGAKENALVQALYNNLQRNSNLSVKIALDANRAQRLDVNGASSVTTLQKVLANKKVQIGMINTGRTNSLVQEIICRFQKWNELLSIYHSKFLIFDDDLIITGANLSSIYFEKRQDRYMCIRGSRLLSDYVYGLIDEINKVDLTGSIRNYNRSYVDLLEKTNGSISNADCFIMPLTQHGPTGLNDHDDFLLFLNSILPASAKVYMSSGYFNPNKAIEGIRIDSVLAPSEEANGFFNGSGLLKFVPRLYTALYKSFLDNHKLCEFLLYKRPDWSFHAKGIWVEGLGDLYAHLIGSSNFNCRSSDRDFETQFFLMTTNKELIARLKNERIALWEQSSQLRKQDISGLNLIYNVVAGMLKNIL